MTNSRAALLLEAIGEISESTIEEAGQPVHRREFRSLRLPALIAASIILIAALSVGIVLAPGAQRDHSSPLTADAKDPVGVSMDDAVSSAMDSLRKTGVVTTLSQARYIADAAHPYYLVMLTAANGTYDCSVDAQSGRVTEIAYQVAPTEPSATEAAARSKQASSASVIPNDSDPADNNDVMPDTAPPAAETVSTDIPPSGNSVPIIEKSSETPTEYPRLDPDDKERKPLSSVSNKEIEDKKQAEKKARDDYFRSSPYYGMSDYSLLNGVSGRRSSSVSGSDEAIRWDPNG